MEVTFLSQISTFMIPTKIIYGEGSVSRIGQVAGEFGPTAVVIAGCGSASKSGALECVRNSLDDSGIRLSLYSGIPQEPDLDNVRRLLRFLEEVRPDVLIALGGGSVLDVGKAASGLYAAPLDISSYFYGEPIPKRSLRWIAMPTTAGTGSEATNNAVLIDREKKIKQSIRRDGWMPDVAIVDPELTYSMPPKVTAFTGMDALTQAIEAATSRYANPLTRPYALYSAQVIGQNIVAAYRNGKDRCSRGYMTQGSLLAGIALANARLGAVHGLAHPLGQRYGLNHGVVCALLLPWVMEYNLPVAKREYARIFRSWGGEGQDVEELAWGAIAYVRNLLVELDFPAGLGMLGLDEADCQDLAELGVNSGSTKANPRAVTPQDLAQILKNAM
jgi:alcohol dehydrogenase class IV